MSDPNHEIARKLLEQLGVQAQDLLPKSDPAPAPTFDEYIARIIPTVSAGTLRTYGTYWQRLRNEWGTRRLDDPTSLEMQALVERIRAGAVKRRNSRGGRSAAEHMVSALRYLYRFAANDGYVRTSNAATELIKPRRLPSPRGAIAAERLHEVIEVVTTTGDDVELDTLLLRLHLETACRTGSALAIRPADLDTRQRLVKLRGKGGTVHWQPISTALLAMLTAHCARGDDPDGQLLRYRYGRPITRRRYDHLWMRAGRQLPWVATQQVSTHWLRHTVLTWVERNFGYAVARAYAAHAVQYTPGGATLTYVRASVHEVADAVSALTSELHPLAVGQSTTSRVLSPLPLPVWTPRGGPSIHPSIDQ
ncbi:tyrosine-type recombinase/integrase [Nocardia sp. NPDC050378]|uniref:tyrosine-type recombinase/integrase n=1 Tax=Nocardia sp. NPDC050378 TaxID=3155400 RepID=UPI0033C03B3E